MYAHEGTRTQLYGMDLRLNDPYPHIRELATIAFLDDVFGRGFLLRWAKTNDCEERVEGRLSELERDSRRS